MRGGKVHERGKDQCKGTKLSQTLGKKTMQSAPSLPLSLQSGPKGRQTHSKSNVSHPAGHSNPHLTGCLQDSTSAFVAQ